MPKASYKNQDAVRFGAIVQRLRRQRGWTLRKLAQRSGMNPTYLGVLETGANMPTLATLLELAEVLNVEAADIVRELERARRPPTPAVLPPA
jgi:transcriptional regulator with XRE-family HTH domain